MGLRASLALMEEASNREEKKRDWPPQKLVLKRPKLPRNGFSMQEQFEKSAAGRAARAQLQGMAKQSANSNKGEPVLKWQMS
ncbi:small VCP/p97-interacting protein [Salix suchowensis]|nr:small VCP/p97-interacting protein [Salix suchowensis]